MTVIMSPKPRRTYTHPSPPAPVLSLFKPKAAVCVLKVAEDGLKFLLGPYCGCPFCVINLSLSFTMSLYLAFMDQWPDLACGGSGI
jgi:hypothetical protein